MSRHAGSRRFVMLICVLTLCTGSVAAQQDGPDRLLRIALSHQSSKRNDSAVIVARKLYSLARDGGDITAQQTACGVLARSYEALGDHRQAYTYRLEETRLRDSIVEESNRASIHEISSRYEAENKVQRIALLEKDRALQELELVRRQGELQRHTLEERQRVQRMMLLGKEKQIESLMLDSTTMELARQRLGNAERAREVALLAKDAQLQESRLSREKIRRNALIAGAGLFLILSGILYNRYRYRKRTTEELVSTLAQLRQTQGQLIHAEKMATLGEMTAGIAHEIKNPLNFVTNFSSLSTELASELYARLEKPDAMQAETDRREVSDLITEVLRCTRKVSEHGMRADRIISNMMMHARWEAGVRQRVDVNRLVEDAVALARSGQRASIAAEDVEILTDFDAGVGAVEVLPQEMARVMLNLVSNAIYAARQRSTAVDAGGETSGDDRQASVPPKVWVETERRDRHIEVRVRDNGPGVPEEIRSRIFQPFFTTKPAGEGTGLGLSMSYDIVVNGHGGTLEFRSSPGDTSFIVSLPILD